MPMLIARPVLATALLASAAWLVLPFDAYAQQAGLRGGVAEDILATSSSKALATRRLAPIAPPQNAYRSEGLEDEGQVDVTYEPIAEPTPPVAAVINTPTSDSDAIDNLRIGAISADPLDDMGRTAAENLRQSPEQGQGAAPDYDPFSPVGIRAGSFVLRPSIEQGLRATTNGNNSAYGSSAVLSETTMRLNAQSDWARHQASLDAFGSFSKSISGEDVSEPRLNLQGNLRLDLGEQTTINSSLGYRLEQESASSPNGITDAVNQPLVQTFDGRLGVERDFGLTFGRATARLERNNYGNADLESGGSLSQKDRNNTYSSVILRGGFQFSPSIRPFAEVEAGKRIYDDRHDINGYQRSGTQLGLRGGAMVDMGEKLNGEFALGMLRESFDDDRLSTINGLSVNAALNWSPQRGTDVRLGASTSVDNATSAGLNGSLLYLANIDVTRQVRSNLSLNARLDTLIRDNKDGSGIDYTIGAQIGATYWINRFVGINGRLRHEFLNSDIEAREYNANSVYLGVTVQR